MKRVEFQHEFTIEDYAYINTQGGKCLRIIDVSFSLLKGVEYLTIDSIGTKEYFHENELTNEKIIEL